ncbi:hypothetical protein VOLCADRAFT_103449 [Volvox carteri f. nagariensis]|uniref:Acid phosphatase n=1 Tax=Volvox carteri f. nagariensis TaxID=3068 RepID=D8TLW6_VOLCA|nr:uncharacterized protein VOLCADRAFT_103449 [Volvox carteri f. nagariensis]EFJ51404.1 hypothetical protein VOLCADRAFT_103449 [Volvox carteri f. nagariensis]|eukprot:XP_002947356.1 hypothetical protein VOLCADRAFT_103449 [Volvox carteri f. nagariensis]
MVAFGCIIHFLLLLLHLFLQTEASLVAVYSIQRHGARNVLRKGALLTEDALVGGPTLLPEGQRQTYTAGVSFQNRYLNSSTCTATSTCLPGRRNGTKYGVLGQPGIGYGNFDVYVRSSALDRSILSGLCFFNGIFPPDPTAPTASSFVPTGAQVVPIYTQSDDDDILIRAYTKCDTYQANLMKWFSSQEFADKAAESAPLRAQVQQMMPPDTNTSLTNWWNVYDSINVYQTYGVGDPVPQFNRTLFQKIQDLAYWLETAKMRSNLTGNMLGGVALADLVNYFQLAATGATNGTKFYYKLLSLSGHYNTQLGILAALELDKWPGASNFTWLTSLPKLAAVLVFELHAADDRPPVVTAPSYYVRLVYQDGPAAQYDTVPLPCASAAGAAAVGPGVCTLGDFLSYTSARALNSSLAWCSACSNFAPGACASARLAALRAARGGDDGDGKNGGGDAEAWKVAVSVVVTFFGAVMLTAVAVWLWQRRRHGGQEGGFGGSLTNLQTAEMAEYQKHSI